MNQTNLLMYNQEFLIQKRIMIKFNKIIHKNNKFCNLLFNKIIKIKSHKDLLLKVILKKIIKIKDHLQSQS